MRDSYVITTEDVTKVCVNEDLYNEIVVSDYFKKELIKKIPALEDVMIERNHDTTSDVCYHITAKMSIPTVNGNEMQNTVENIMDLTAMGKLIIRMIEAHGKIPMTVNAIAKDCKPWFKNAENNETA